MGFLGTLCILLVFTFPLCLARYTPSDSVFSVGSGDGEGTIMSSPTQSYELNGFTTRSPGSYPNGTSTSFNIFDSITQFLKEYMLLVIVVGSLAILMIFIVCAAVIMSHRHKASAYYPSSFSQKEYVNQDDKSGEAKSFHEIPEKVNDTKTEEVVDSTKQLQADILSAAQNLKSPTKGTSIKEDQKIQDEPNQTKEAGPVQENMEEAPICNTKEESPTEKVEKAASEQVEESPTVNNQDSPPIEDIQKTQEEVCACVEGANSTSCEGNPTYNNSTKGQESQQTSDTCTA